MKNIMKLLSACLLAGLLTGCGSLQWQPKDELARLEGLARLTSFTGSAVYLSAHPEDAAKFSLARQGVEALLSGGTVDPIALREALAGIGLKEMRADRTAILITAALLMVEEFGEVEAVGTESKAKAVAKGISQGLDLALKTVGPAPAPAAPGT